MGRKLKWAGLRHKTPWMKMTMATATREITSGHNAMQCKSLRGKRDEQAEAQPQGYVSGGEGQDGYNVGVCEGLVRLSYKTTLHVYVIVTLILKARMGAGGTSLLHRRRMNLLTMATLLRDL